MATLCLLSMYLFAFTHCDSTFSAGGSLARSYASDCRSQTARWNAQTLVTAVLRDGLARRLVRSLGKISPFRQRAETVGMLRCFTLRDDLTGSEVSLQCASVLFWQGGLVDQWTGLKRELCSLNATE